MRALDIFSEAQGPARPRLFYRGTNPGDTRRIRTGEPDWDRFLFVSSRRDGAAMYGSHIAVYRAKPDAKILYEGTRAFMMLAKGLFKPGTGMLASCAEVMRRAEAAGYDAVWFKQQADIGTAIIRPEAFERIEEADATPTAP